MNFFKTFNNSTTSNLISFGSLIVSVTAFVWGWCNSDRTSTLENQLLAYQYQPRLSLIRAPHIKEVRTLTESFNPDSIEQIPQDSNSSIPIVKLPGKLSITSQLFLKNSGNALAKIFGYIQTDTTSFIPMIRQSFLRSIRNKESIIVTEFERLNEVLPGDSTMLTFQHEVAYFDSNKFTLHYLILYENESGNLYDTYIWSQFIIKDYPMDVQISQVGAEKVMRVNYPKVKAGDLVISANPPNDSYFTYTVAESEEIRSFYKILIAKNKK